MSRYIETWKDNSHFLSALLRPELPIDIKLEPGLNALYEDCYQTLLIGRYNASIVMLGLFLEALMKERIRLKTGQDFKCPYGSCVQKLRNGYLIDPIDIAFLDKFREKIRNTYAHFDEVKVVDGRILRGWEIPFEEIIDPAKFEATFNEIKTGKRKPLLLYAMHPALRSISKLDSDCKIAVGLFNLVYDFMLRFVIKYLRQKDYDEHNKKYGKPFVDLSPVLKVKGSRTVAYE